MNAFARDLSAPPCLPSAMARDLLGVAGLPASAVTYHAMLSSRDTGILSLVDCTIAAGVCIPSHLHSHEDEICVVLSGIMEFRMEDRILRRRTGECILIPRGAAHEVRAVTEARHISLLRHHEAGCGQPS